MHEDAAAALASLERFLTANREADLETVNALLARSSRENGGFEEPNDQFNDVSLGEPEPHSDGWMIPVHAPPGREDDMSPLPAIMIYEDGGWKLDLAASILLLYGGPEGVQEVFTEMMDTLGAMAQGAFEAIGDAVGSLGAGAALPVVEENPEPGSLAARLIEAAPEFDRDNWEQVEPYPTSEELETLPPTFALPETTAAISEALFDTVRAVVTFNDMHWPIEGELRAQIDSYIAWLDSEFMKPWAEILPTIARIVPLIGRMNCLRFEPITSRNHRYLIADGNAMVLRMATGEGCAAIGPNQLVALGCGVAAALPEAILPQFDGTTREVPAEGDYDAGPAWFERVAPRQMRRISNLLGRPVRLCADPDRLLLHDDRDLRLYRCGLGRILGGIVLSLCDPAYTDIVRGQLHTIWIADEFESGRELRFENGILRCTIPSYDQDQTGAFVEHQIASAFAGEAIADGPEV